MKREIRIQNKRQASDQGEWEQKWEQKLKQVKMDNVVQMFNSVYFTSAPWVTSAIKCLDTLTFVQIKEENITKWENNP